MKKKVVITGCGGMLGEAVYDKFKNKFETYATDIDLNEDWLEHLDVRDKEYLQGYLTKVRPDYIIHLAALTDMEYCELHPHEAYETNANGVQNVANYTSQNDIPLVYISTAGIFDGEKEEYKEEDKPNPLSIYGKSKFKGELISRNFPKLIIIRAGWMMGGGPKKDKKFINKLVKQINAGKKEIMAVDDKLGTPCYTDDLAGAIFYLLTNNLYGLYHGICEGGGSRYDIAKYLIELLGLSDEVSVVPVDSVFFEKNFEEKYFAPRPRSERLVNLKLKKLNPSLTRDWRLCLKEYISKYDWLARSVINQVIPANKT